MPVAPQVDPILGLDSFFELLRAMKAFKLVEYYASCFARNGNTYYSLTLGRKLIMTCDRENIKSILTNMEAWPIAGPRLYMVLPVLGPHSIFSSNGPIWHEARSTIRPSFTRDQVADLAWFNKHIDNLLAAIPADGTTFDIQDLLLKMTMDSSTDFMLGYSTNSLLQTSPEGSQFLSDFDRHYQALEPFSLRRAINKGAKDSSVAAPERSYIFLDELLKLNVPEEYVIDQILSIIIAGRDTTAIATAAVFYYLARDPESVRRIREEIAQLGVDNPSWEELRGMRFLNNVVRESLWLFPPIPLNSREAGKETVLPHGGGPDGKSPALVPKGTPVRWSLYSLHRNKEVHGPDADEFRPDRWESLRLGWDYIPFHGGPQICLGQQFSLSQMAYLLYMFFKTFRGIEAHEEGEMLLHYQTASPWKEAIIESNRLSNGCK
ncbi:cytochrome P450 [Cercophora newfieldiana]|uniref:Cytochrome P450 n=1 Tax=Cercophora newfieldiana TaxID=92897 RepID=A0AA40CYP3_9PEZI|nr:cytochrome P450 [Cercophora newfieldiana]